MSNEIEVVEAVKDLNKNDTLTQLIAEEGFDLKKANAYWKEYGTKTAVGFAGSFYDKLREGSMSDEAFYVIITEGSPNVQKHSGHYDAIRKLANDIHGE